MITQTPDWLYWWAIADTHVKLSQCIALSLNINPHLIDFRPSYLGKTGLWKLEPNSVNAFHARYRILTAHRQNGACFTVDPPGRSERLVNLREFARWGLHKFKIPNELAVLATIGDNPLPEPRELAKLVMEWRAESVGVDSAEIFAIAKATTSRGTKDSPSGSVNESVSSRDRRLNTKEQRAHILAAMGKLGIDRKKLPKTNGKSGAKKRGAEDVPRNQR